MNNYSAFASDIKSRVPLKDAMERLGITFNRSGFAVCPFHAEKTASFRIKGEYGHCFGCGWNGDVIKFTEDLLNLSFKQAVEYLNDNFGLNLPLNRRPTLRDRQDIRQRKRAAMLQQKWRVLEQYMRDEYAIIEDQLWAEKFRLEDEIIRLAPDSIDAEWDEQFVRAVLDKERIDRRLDNFYRDSIDDIIAAGKSGEKAGGQPGTQHDPDMGRAGLQDKHAI